MKKWIVILMLAISINGYASAGKKKKVHHSTKPTSTSKSSAKLTEVEAAPKKKTSESFQSWLKEMKKRVAHTNTKQNQLVAVAAVRGSETPDTPPLYWKGKKGEGKVQAPEIKDFETAIDAALSGDSVAAKEKLQSFVLAYPQSSLVADANETLTKLDATAPTANP